MGSIPLIAFFVGTTAVTVYVLLRQAGSRDLNMMVCGWLAITGLIGVTGAVSDFSTKPPRIAPLLVVATALTIVLAFSRIGLNLSQAPMAWLIGWQAFRIPVEVFLDWGYREGFVPVQMTWEGRNLDIVTGVTALILGWLAGRKPLPSAAVWLWNIAGLMLLVNVVTVAILSMPTPFRQFFNDPPNIFVARFPFLWLPAVLVQAALLGHLLIFRRLVSDRRAT